MKIGTKANLVNANFELRRAVSPLDSQTNENLEQHLEVAGELPLEREPPEMEQVAGAPKGQRRPVSKRERQHLMVSIFKYIYKKDFWMKL